jgi:hypothetical protein
LSLLRKFAIVSLCIARLNFAPKRHNRRRRNKRRNQWRIRQRQSLLWRLRVCRRK